MHPIEKVRIETNTFHCDSDSIEAFEALKRRNSHRLWRLICVDTSLEAIEPIRYNTLPT